MKRLAAILLCCSGCVVRPCPICGFPAIENRGVLVHFVPNLEPGPCAWRATTPTITPTSDGESHNP